MNDRQKEQGGEVRVCVLHSFACLESLLTREAVVYSGEKVSMVCVRNVLVRVIGEKMSR